METGDNKVVEQNCIVQTGKKSILSAGNTEQDGCVSLQSILFRKIVTYRYRRIVDCLIN